jgi:methyl-accepting chemotaxis protein/ribose transport system substrate-binding protein
LYVKKELKNKNTNVEIILPDLSKGMEDSLIDCINKCIQNGYDGICLPAFSNGIIPAVNRAVEKGLVVMTYICDFDKESKRLACIQLDAYQAGVIAGEVMTKTVDSKGTILIINHKSMTYENRVKGFKEQLLKNSKLCIEENTIKGDVPEETYDYVINYIKENKEVQGIYLPGGYQVNAAKAIVDSGMAGKIKLIVYDVDKEICHFIKKGVITCALGQNPFGQGFEPAVYLYNYLVTKEKPVSENIWTRTELVDKYNVDRILI